MKLMTNRIISRRLIAGLVLVLITGEGPAAGRFVKSTAALVLSGPAAVQAPRQSTASKHSSGATITGKVLLDGAAGAEVQVSVTPLRQLAGGASFTAMMTRTESEQTDDDGSFVAEGLEPGAYAVSVEAPGYIVTSGLTDEDGKQIYSRPGDQLTIRMIKGGVITGKVTDSQGQPIVQAPVHAVRLRDERGHPAKGNPKALSGFVGPHTDDRGIYRVYGLEPGVYLVSAGGGEQFSSTPFTNDSQVYHPSGTVDVAAEVKVQAGQETGGIDISYSSIPGHSLSGHLAGQFATGGMASMAVLVLTHLKTGVPQAETMSMGDSHAFRIEGVPDGEYLLTALSYSFGKDLTMAPPRKIVVKGSDLTGIDLTLGPITTISGKVAIQGLKQDDQKSGCKTSAPKRVEEVVVAPHPSEKSRAAEQVPMVLDLTESSPGYMTSPDAKGEFTAQLPNGGSYHIETELLDEDLFLSSVTLPADSAGKRPKDASGGISVKNTERLTDVTVTVAQGAATVAGRITTSTSGSSLPERLRAYLVPLEKEAADNTLRYYQAFLRRDGSFEVKHIAPGRYYIVTRTLLQEEWDEVNPRPIWWGAASRQKLRQDAEKANNVVEVKPCQQMKGVVVPYGAAGSAPASGPAKPPGAAACIL
jgi:hypothetical protein